MQRSPHPSRGHARPRREAEALRWLPQGSLTQSSRVQLFGRSDLPSDEPTENSKSVQGTESGIVLQLVWKMYCYRHTYVTQRQ